MSIAYLEESLVGLDEADFSFDVHVGHGGPHEDDGGREKSLTWPRTAGLLVAGELTA